MRVLASRLRPDLMVGALEDVDLDWLAHRDIRGILLDVDNTLTPWRSRQVSQAKRRWIRAARAQFAICLLSNTIFLGRLRGIADELDLPYVGCWGLTRKPLPWGVRAALAKIRVPARHACIIGDQVFADILAGKMLGITTILVEPVQRGNEFIGTRLIRLLEERLRGAWRAAWEKEKGP